MPKIKNLTIFCSCFEHILLIGLSSKGLGTSSALKESLLLDHAIKKFDYSPFAEFKQNGKSCHIFLENKIKSGGL